MLTADEIKKIVGRIECSDRSFVITASTSQYDGSRLITIHVEYEEADVDVPDGLPMTQRSRRWIIEPTDGETEIVNTCFAAVMRSYDHVVKEHFTYDGVRVFSPHTSIEKRMELARR